MYGSRHISQISSQVSYCNLSSQYFSNLEKDFQRFECFIKFWSLILWAKTKLSNRTVYQKPWKSLFMGGKWNWRVIFFFTRKNHSNINNTYCIIQVYTLIKIKEIDPQAKTMVDLACVEFLQVFPTPDVLSTLNFAWYKISVKKK